MARLKRNPLNYADCVRLCSKRGVKKIAGNTTVRIENGRAIIRLHSTDIITITPHEGGDEYTLSTGGWRTTTTKARINTFTPFGVYQRNYQWFLMDGTPFVENVTLFA